jgi:hypothetical protein
VVFQEVRHSITRGGGWLASMGFEQSPACLRLRLAPQDSALDPCGLSWTPQQKRGTTLATRSNFGSWPGRSIPLSSR